MGSSNVLIGKFQKEMNVIKALIKANDYIFLVCGFDYDGNLFRFTQFDRVRFRYFDHLIFEGLLVFLLAVNIVESYSSLHAVTGAFKNANMGILEHPVDCSTCQDWVGKNLWPFFNVAVAG